VNYVFKMALENAAPVIGMKDRNYDENSLIHYGIGEALSSKLTSLSLSSVMMSTPPALLTPSPPVLISDPLDHKVQRERGFRVAVVRVEDSDRVIDFLRRSFFVDEPLNAALRLLETSGDRCIPLEEFAAADIHQGLSVMAVNDDGKILGVLLGAAVQRHEAEQDNVDWSIGCDHPKFAKTLRFLYQSEKKCDVFSWYPDLDSLFDIKIISVDSSCRGQGVAGIMANKAFQMAREAKLGFLKIDCSSHFSSLIADKFGCKENYSIPYADYKVDGEVVFATSFPHLKFCIKSTRL